MFVLIESVRVAWLGVSGNKLRTALTMLGVIIGVAAVIAMVSVGQGAQAEASRQIQALGSNLITVSARGANRIEERDLTNLKAQIPGLLFALPQANANQQAVRADGEPYSVDIEGTGADYPAVRERGLLTGSWFSAEQVDTRQKVAILGLTTVTHLFDAGVDPLGQSIRMMGQTFTVIGVAEPKGTGLGGDMDDRIFVPYTTLSRLVGLNRIPILTVKTASATDSVVVAQQLTDYFVAKFRSEEAVRVQSQDQILETVGGVTQIFTLLLGAIASISLAVGGIGIMNIMLVSVSERTREIGIRKAIGAKQRDVLLQFLIEAIMLSVAGGGIGILVGASGALGLGGILGFAPIITSTSILLSFGFSAAVGIIFGFYPAYRASNLDPIEALRRD